MRLFVPSRRLILTAALMGAAAALATSGVQHVHRPGRVAVAAAGSSPLARVAQAAAYRAGDTGFDLSWPQCGGDLPLPGAGLAIVGVNGGQPYSINPCFAREWSWAASSPSASVYINLDRKAADIAAYGWTGPHAGCATADEACASYDEGWTSAYYSFVAVASMHAKPVMWWLDVETGEDWSCPGPCDTRSNAQLVQGAIDLLRVMGQQVGVYSNPGQWATLVGDYAPGLPLWTTDYDDPRPQSHCGDADTFGGGQVYIVQTLPGAYDPDFACRTQIALR